MFLEEVVLKFGGMETITGFVYSCAAPHQMRILLALPFRKEPRCPHFKTNPTAATKTCNGPRVKFYFKERSQNPWE